MVLSMVAPIFLALGAPVTLALRTLPAGPRRALLAVLHSRVAQGADVPAGVVRRSSWPTRSRCTSPASTGCTLEHAWVHELVHVHFIAVGCLFFWPLIGLDPLPGRLAVPGCGRC